MASENRFPERGEGATGDSVRMRVKVEETAAAVKEVGAQNFILATDLGQTGNPSPADGLQLFVTDLMKAGLSKDQITTMGREVTGKLLMG